MPPMNPSNPQRQTVLICLALALAVLAAYGQLWDCDFVAIDDGDYVTANSMVQQGLSWSGLVWAFTTLHCSIWHPLTWLSYLVDFQIYGMNPAGYHATSLLLHLANSILLFLLLQRLTKARWPSALAAALFALHPLHVESVAWISERKDVLSTLFWMLTVWAYVRYVEEINIRKMNHGLPGSHGFDSSSVPSGPSAVKSNVFYLLSLVLFALGLMAKPMLVTLPFILLLLDFWPLQRRPFPHVRLLVEKIPFFILAAAACLLTVLVARHNEVLAPTSDIPVEERLANAVVSYARYIGKTFCPINLAVLYPYQKHWPVWEIAGSAALLALVSGLVIWRARAQPYLAVGWFWFLGMLVPVIGLVQIGAHSMADRYDYLPSIGLTIMLIWAAKEWFPPSAPRLPAVLGWLAVAGCMAATRLQVEYWSNSETLFRHATEVTQGNGLMESSLGRALFLEGRKEEAMAHLRLGAALTPENPVVHYNLGYALLSLQRAPQAVEQLDIAVTMAPKQAAYQFALGAALLKNGQVADAIRHLELDRQFLSNDADSHYELATAFLQSGSTHEAIAEFEKVLQIQPDHLQANTSLAWILAGNPDPSLRDGARAVALALRADQLAGGQNPIILGTLAAAYAEVGNFSQATATAGHALQLAGPQTNSPVAAALRAQIALYQSGSPFRDTNAAPLASPPASMTNP
jgi:tetratricopeptide (TPR) repeat protein